jgi:hypothetical protein
MLTIQFPKGIKKYPTDKKQQGKIWIEREQEENNLFIECFFSDYSFYLEEIPCVVAREKMLFNKTVVVINESDAELSANEGHVDLRVINASITFEEVEEHLLIKAVGELMLHDSEDPEGVDAVKLGMNKDEKAAFSFQTTCMIRQGKFMLEFAYGLEYSMVNVEELDKMIIMACKGLREMANKSKQATELVAVTDLMDESALRIYGRDKQLIIEGVYPIDNEQQQFVLAHRNVSSVSIMMFKPDSVNQSIDVELDEFFSVKEVEYILEQFIRLRFLDTRYYLIKKKSYLF